MYRILVVDDDETCSIVAKACLKRWNYYEARAVSHPLQVLSILDEEEKPYDLVLADVHMPVMDGFELLQHVNTKFNIPVVLISADDKAEIMCKGLRNGAPAYLLKPITVDAVRHIWQYSVLWKNKERDTYRRITQAIGVPRSISSSSSFTRNNDDKPRGKKAKEMVWTPNLHNRFVEVMLILGPRDAVPKNILDLMNVQSLTREQVASHLQKFRKFLESVLDGNASLDGSSKKWIDCNYYSSIVGGNPNQILIDQLFEKRRTGKWADPIPSSRPLPPFKEADASSSRSRIIAMLVPKNCTSSSVNVATPTLGQGGVTFQSDVNGDLPTAGHVGGTYFQSAGSLNMGNIVGSSNAYNNPVQNLTYDEGNPIGRYNQNAVVPQPNHHLANTNLQVGNVQLHHDPFIHPSFGANQFGITLGLNEQLGSIQLGRNTGNASARLQLGGGTQIADGGWFINNHDGVNNIPAAADYSLLGFDPNQNQGGDWGDLLRNFDDEEEDM